MLFVIILCLCFSSSLSLDRCNQQVILSRWYHGIAIVCRRKCCQFVRDVMIGSNMRSCADSFPGSSARTCAGLVALRIAQRLSKIKHVFARVASVNVNVN